MWNEVLLKWKHYLIDETTCENEAKFKTNFFDFLSSKTMTSFWKGSNVNNQRRMVEMMDIIEKLSTKS
jgi:hypothetical protein